jgi:hypothetical protein
MSHFHYKLAAVYILSAASVQTSVWPKGVSCDVYRVEPDAVLYCIARWNTVCFTLDRVLSGPRSGLDTNGKEISASHQDTNPYIVCTAWHIWSLSANKEMTIRQADGYISVAVRPNYPCLMRLISDQA